jgi:hypothetical protein
MNNEAKKLLDLIKFFKINSSLEIQTTDTSSSIKEPKQYVDKNELSFNNIANNDKWKDF